MKNNLLVSRHTRITLFAFFLFLTHLLTTTDISSSSFMDNTPLPITTSTNTRMARWSHNGNYLALVADSNGTTNSLAIYRWNGNTFTSVKTLLFNGFCICTAWSPDDRFLVISGTNIENLGHNLAIYSWNGTTLTRLDQKTNTNWMGALAWTPDGKYLAVGGHGAGSSALFLYSWNGTTLTQTDQRTYKTTTTAYNEVYDVAFSADGNYLAVAGNIQPADGGPPYGLYVYQKNGDTLTDLTSQSNPANTWYSSVDWHPTKNYLAAGTYNSTNYTDMYIYTFNGSSLTTTSSQYNGLSVPTVRWSHDGKYLAAGGTQDNRDLRVYQLGTNTLNQPDASSLAMIFSQQFGTRANGIDWSPDDTYLSVAGTYETQSLITYKRNNAFNGLKSNIYFQNQTTFPNGGIITGNVQFKNGFLLGKSQTLELETFLPICGQINLEDSALLKLKNDINFGSNFSLISNLGIISGNGHAISLSNNLTTLNNTILHIASDTLIDGHNNILTLGRWSQIFVDSNVTLTLRNMTIRNTINNKGLPFIKCAAQTSKLALDNIILAPLNDFYFNEGQLFIHNDVVFTGTSQFIYKSSQSSFIAQSSMLTFEPNTTFFYDTINSYTKTTYLASGLRNYHQDNNLLINMQNSTSALYLDGCTLHISHTGLRLTKGQLFFDNHVTLENNTTPSFSSLSNALSSQPFAIPFSVSWSSNGKFLAVVGSNEPTDVIVYQWDGTNLIDLGSKAKKISGINAQSVSLSPDGKYLAVGGNNETTNVIVYQWDGASLINLGTGAEKAFGVQAQSVSWSPDGKHLAVGGGGGTKEVIVYQWDGTNLIDLGTEAEKDYDGYVYAISWSPDGKYLAVGGNSISNNVILYKWNGTSLINLGAGAQKTFGDLARPVSWSPDGKYLAVGGYYSTPNIIVYQWDGTNLIDLGTEAQKKFSDPTNSASWSPDGKYLAVGGGSGTPNVGLIVYQWNGTHLIDLGSGGKKNYTGPIGAISWNPDGKYLAVGGDNSSADVSVYQLIQNTLTYNPTHAQSILFGNSALGQNYNLGINLLKNAKVTVNGLVWPDNVL